MIWRIKCQESQSLLSHLPPCGLASAARCCAAHCGLAYVARQLGGKWRVVCREKTVWRTNKWGQSKRVTVRDCDRMGRGPGYYGADRPRYAEPSPGRSLLSQWAVLPRPKLHCPDPLTLGRASRVAMRKPRRHSPGGRSLEFRVAFVGPIRGVAMPTYTLRVEEDGSGEASRTDGRCCLPGPRWSPGARRS